MMRWGWMVAVVWMKGEVAHQAAGLPAAKASWHSMKTPKRPVKIRMVLAVSMMRSKRWARRPPTHEATRMWRGLRR